MYFYRRNKFGKEGADSIGKEIKNLPQNLKVLHLNLE